MVSVVWFIMLTAQLEVLPKKFGATIIIDLVLIIFFSFLIKRIFCEELLLTIFRERILTFRAKIRNICFCFQFFQ